MFFPVARGPIGLVAFCVALGTCYSLAGAQTDLRGAIERGMARTKESVQAVKMKVRVVHRIGQAQGGNGDEVLEYEQERLIDFEASRSAYKGFFPRFKMSGFTVEDAWTEWEQTASNANYAYLLKPKERRDPRSVPPGIKQPVEFLKIAIPEGGNKNSLELTAYPVSFWAGAFASPEQPITGKDRRAQCSLDGWKIDGPQEINGQQQVTLTSPPTPHGLYFQCQLSTKLDYRPTHWVQHFPAGERKVIDIAYKEQPNAIPLLASWTIHEHDSAGILLRQLEYKVLEMNVNPPLSDELFVLEPTDGMIIEEEVAGGAHLGFRVAGRPEFQASTNYELNDTLDEVNAKKIGLSQWMVISTVAGLVGTLAICAFYLWKRAHRAT